MLRPLIGLSRFGLSNFFSSATAGGKLTRNLLTGVDIGTSKACVLIAEIELEGGIDEAWSAVGAPHQCLPLGCEGG